MIEIIFKSSDNLVPTLTSFVALVIALIALIYTIRTFILKRGLNIRGNFTSGSESSTWNPFRMTPAFHSGRAEMKCIPRPMNRDGNEINIRNSPELIASGILPEACKWASPHTREVKTP